MIRVNGISREEAAGLILSEFLEQAGFVQDRIAVERNGELVRRAEYANLVLEAGDTLEIVQFVGGG
ncbi:MAG: sulfur carrier protein ThiS [Clostridiaceae bacterium]